jgi:hypothetical protein
MCPQAMYAGRTDVTFGVEERDKLSEWLSTRGNNHNGNFNDPVIAVGIQAGCFDINNSYWLFQLMEPLYPIR